MREINNVDTLLSRACGVMNPPPLKKPNLLKRDKPKENEIISNRNDLRNDFVHTIA